MNPWLLFLIGMTTVIIVLFVVILIGKMVIHFTNRWIAENKPTPIQSIPPQHLAALVSTVDWLTSGEGHVIKVTPQEKYQEV